MPETTVRPSHENPDELTLERRSFFGAAVDSFTKPPAQDPDRFEVLEDVEPVVSNRLERRRGYTLLSNPTVAARRMFEAHYTSGANRIILAASDGGGAETDNNMITAINEDGARGHATNDILIPSVNASFVSRRQPSIAVSRQFAYIMDGGSTQVFKRWDGVDDPATANSVADWGMSASGAVFTAADGGAGVVTLEVGRRYLVAFLYTNNSENQAVLYDITSGGTDEQHTTDSVEFAGPVTSRQVNLASLPTYTIGSSGFVAANMHRVILATSDGGPLDTLYEIGRVTDNTTTTFTDNISEDSLLAKPIWAELTADGREVGIYDNTRPSTTIPNATIVVNHKGRLYAITEQFLHWSKNLSDLTTSTNTVAGRYEGCWPAANQYGIAVNEEFGRGLLSDGVRLYVATDRGIKRVEDYSGFPAPPVSVFNEVGLMRQDTWRLIFHEGRQIGAMWLTPDRRVIFSDFNSYHDAGMPIQDLLDDMNVARARLTSNAVFVSDGPYELYMLAVPTPGVSSGTADSGTAQAGSATTITLRAGASATDDAYNSYLVTITGGTGSGQTRTISDYVGSTKVATISPVWTTNPDATSTYTVTIPEPETLCVYNLAARFRYGMDYWVTWKPAEGDGALGSPGTGIYAQGFLQDIVNNRALWMFSTANGSPSDGRVYRWHVGTELDTANNHRDRNSAGETPVTFDVTIRTGWLDWGIPQVTKLLNRLELLTGDATLTVRVEGASTEAKFATPDVVMAATTVTADIFGQYRAPNLAAKFSHHRFFRFTFNAPAGTATNLMNYLAIHALPTHA